ncbi:MAG: S8 family serine peptidase [Clostridium sp.]
MEYAINSTEPNSRTEDLVTPFADLTVMKISGFHGLETTKGSGIKVAIIDSGCNVNHADLAGKIVGVKNFTTDDAGAVGNVTDYNGQGTAMAGIIASSAANYPGVAPGVQLYILKASGINGGTGTMAQNAFIHAINLGVDVIVTGNSFASNLPDLEALCNSAVKQNSGVVCGAGVNGDGNAATDEFLYPGGFNSVITVGFTNTDKTINSLSNSHNQIDLVAVGQNVSTLDKGGGYVTYSGSAYSAAYVGGAYALIKKFLQVKYGRTIEHNEVYAGLLKRTLDLNQNMKLQGAGMLYMMADIELRQLVLGV